MRHWNAMLIAAIFLSCLSFSVAIDSIERLRTSTTAEVGEGERAIIGLDKIADSLSDVGVSGVLWFWLLFQKKTADDVFAYLKLDQGVENALSDKKLYTFSKCVDIVNTKYPEKKMSVLGMLTAKYGEVAVAKELTKQLRGWLNGEKPAKDVFTLLKIVDDDVAFAISPKLETLDEYIKLLNAKSPQHKTDLFKTLRDGFGGEDKFAVVVSKAVANAPTASKEALEFQEMMFKRWVASDYDPMTVLTKVF
ncbi:hypothetical protein PInf_019125 [Phytophthora infestans]|nr:hypothetical protein PInf_019125 [Phytophthora infestans]